MKTNRDRILWITRTGVLVALLVVLQWATAGTSAFAGQYITGSCVNAVLGVAALAAGVWSAAVVALLSPFFAFVLGIGPKLLPIVPAIALGNLVYVLLLWFLAGRRPLPVWGRVAALLCAAAAKFLTLYLVVVRLLLPALAANVPAKQIETFTLMFSWPQLFTALLGGAAALLIAPVLQKALKK